MSCVWISKQTAIISLYSINLPFFITEAEIAYCEVRTGRLNQTGFRPEKVNGLDYRTEVTDKVSFRKCPDRE
jgi:hypothetical protein